MANVSSMLVHHSSTASKQWDETLTLSLRRRRQTHRAHFPRVASLDGFDERWDAFLDFFVHSVANGAKGLVPRRHLRVTDDHLVARVHAGDAPGALLAMSSSVRRRVARV